MAYLIPDLAVGNGPTRSIPHIANGYGLTICVSSVEGALGILANLWHLSHFREHSAASRLISGQKYLYRRIFFANVWPPE